MKKIEDIFDLALSKYKQGYTKEEILEMWPEQKEQLSRLLNIAEIGLNLPKKAVPKPVMQKKFMLLPVENRVKYAWLRFSRLATVSVSFTLLLAAIVSTGYAATRSVPGERLFTVKKSAEQIRLRLASTPEKKADLQLEIAKKRLSEAEKVFKDQTAGPKKEQAAIAELINVTSQSVKAVEKVAINNPDPKHNEPIIASLESINNQQQALLVEIRKNDTGIATKAEESTNENANKLAEIKKYIQVAANERALTNLNNASSTDEAIKGTATSTEGTGLDTSTSTTETTATGTIESSKIIPEEVLDAEPTVTGTFIIEDPSPQFKP